MLGAILLMAWNLLTALAALALVGRVGRRKLLLSGLGAMVNTLTAPCPPLPLPLVAPTHHIP